MEGIGQKGLNFSRLLVKTWM
jgi:hypothetical protein